MRCLVLARILTASLRYKCQINRHQASVKEESFEEVLNTDSSQYNILAYAQFLAYKGDQQAALKHIEAACVMVKIYRL